MQHATRKRMAIGILGLGLAIVPLAGQVSAQTTHDRTGVDTGTTSRTTRDDGFNMGWLGLLGLAGLAGLLPRNNRTHHPRGDVAGR
jgi:MYXO-CTERM domain-containing protein